MKKVHFATTLLLLLICLVACSEQQGADVPRDSHALDSTVETKPFDETSNRTADFSDITDYTETKEEATEEATEVEKEEGTEAEIAYEIYNIDNFSEGLASISTSMGFGYMDMNGTIPISPTYDGASAFCDGFARIEKDGKYGYIDKSGKLVIDIIYEEAPTELMEITLVAKDGIRQYINRMGQAVYTAKGNEVAFGEFSNGFFWVDTLQEKVSGNVTTLTYYNASGIAVSSHIGYKNIGEYSSVNEYGHAFAMNESSGEAIEITLYGDEPLYPGEIHNENDIFSNLHIEGFYVSGNEGIYYLDYQNQKALSADKILQPNDSNTSWAITHWTKYGMDGENIYLASSVDFGTLTSYLNFSTSHKTIDTSGIFRETELLLDLHNVDAYNGVMAFQGVECWKMNTSNGPKLCFTIRMINPNRVTFYSVIDEYGNVLIEPTSKYELGYEYREEILYIPYTHYVNYTFQGGLCIARDTTTGLYGYIDLQGNWAIQPQYDQVTDFHERGDNAVAVVNGNTIINRNGEVIFTIAQ